MFLIFTFNTCFLFFVFFLSLGQHLVKIHRKLWGHWEWFIFSKENSSLSVFLLLPLSFSYTCRHLRRYVYVLDKLYFPHYHCSTLQHCFSTLSDNGEELLSLTCSHILRSYASRLLTSAVCLLHAACCMWLIIACLNGIHVGEMIAEEISIWNGAKWFLKIMAGICCLTNVLLSTLCFMGEREAFNHTVGT